MELLPDHPALMVLHHPSLPVHTAPHLNQALLMALHLTEMALDLTVVVSEAVLLQAAMEPHLGHHLVTALPQMATVTMVMVAHHPAATVHPQLRLQVMGRHLMEEVIVTVEMEEVTATVEMAAVTAMEVMEEVTAMVEMAAAVIATVEMVEVMEDKATIATVDTFIDLN